MGELGLEVGAGRMEIWVVVVVLLLRGSVEDWVLEVGAGGLVVCSVKLAILCVEILVEFCKLVICVVKFEELFGGVFASVLVKLAGKDVCACIVLVSSSVVSCE